MPNQRKHIQVRGIVQGVGFRPFVYNLAHSLGLTGFVFNSSSGVTIEIQRAEGAKCERCWKYTLDVGSDAQFPTLCAACGDAIK